MPIIKPHTKAHSHVLISKTNNIEIHFDKKITLVHTFDYFICFLKSNMKKKQKKKN
jgi:hypothetical protein